jgi:hypothetical protein
VFASLYTLSKNRKATDLRWTAARIVLEFLQVTDCCLIDAWSVLEWCLNAVACVQQQHSSSSCSAYVSCRCSTTATAVNAIEPDEVPALYFNSSSNTGLLLLLVCFPLLQMFRVVFNTVFNWKIDTSLW